MNDAMRIATQHTEWARSAGFSPEAVCISVGLHVTRFMTWDDARLAVALAWRKIAKTLRSAAA